MKYVEMTIEEAMNTYGKQAKVLVATHNLEDEDTNLEFIPKRKEDCCQIFNDVKTVATACDEFMRKMRCFTEKQDIYDIKPIGIEKIILLQRE